MANSQKAVVETGRGPSQAATMDVSTKPPVREENGRGGASLSSSAPTNAATRNDLPQTSGNVDLEALKIRASIVAGAFGGLVAAGGRVTVKQGERITSGGRQKFLYAVLSVDKHDLILVAGGDGLDFDVVAGGNGEKA